MKRPICVVCLIFFCLYYLMIQWIPLPVFDYEDGQHLYAKGIVSQVSITEYGQVILLKQVYISETEPKELKNLSKSNKIQRIQSQNNQFKQLHMDIKVYLEKDVSISPGQYVLLCGRYEAFRRATNPGEFDDKVYESSQNIGFALKKAEVISYSRKVKLIQSYLYKLRQSLAEAYEKNARHVSLFQTMILGMKQELEREIKSLYQRNGVSHLLAISALHLSIIGMALYRVLRAIGMPLWITTGASVLILCAFGEMTGSSVSTVRALIMFGLSVLAVQIGRTYDLQNALAISFLAMTLCRPRIMLGTGFQLSFTAVLGIGMILPYLVEHFGRGCLKDMLFVSVSVQLFTLPIMVSTYYEVQVYAVLINLLVVPFMAVVLLLGMLGGIVGIFAGDVRYIFILPDLILDYYERICHIADSLPCSRIVVGKPMAWQVILYYAVLLIFLNHDAVWSKLKNALRKRQGRDGRAGVQEDKKVNGKADIIRGDIQRKLRKSIVECLLCVIVLVGILYVPTQVRRIARCEMTMLDIGQGDCICLQLHGKTILIDGGSSSKKQIGKYQVEPFLKSQGIACVDYLLLSHPDLDHMSGFNELLEEAYSTLHFKTLGLTAFAQKALQGDVAEDGVSEKQAKADTANVEDESLLEGCKRCGMRCVLMKAGDVIRIRDKGSLMCLLPEEGENFQDVNDSSMVLLLRINGQRVLFLGDLPAKREKLVLEKLGKNEDSIQRLSVLKVSHHGSKTGSDEAFINGTTPLISLISCGRNNRYGHPHQEVIDRLLATGSHVYRTDEMGAITVQLRRNGVRVQCFRR